MNWYVAHLGSEMGAGLRMNRLGRNHSSCNLSCFSGKSGRVKKHIAARPTKMGEKSQLVQPVLFRGGNLVSDRPTFDWTGAPVPQSATFCRSQKLKLHPLSAPKLGNRKWVGGLPLIPVVSRNGLRLPGTQRQPPQHIIHDIGRCEDPSLCQDVCRGVFTALSLSTRAVCGRVGS